MVRLPEIIKKIEKAGLIGRGCCNFPTAKKWQMVYEQPGEKYIVCNVSEGELAVFKDEWILRNHPEIAIEGIKIALKTFKAKKAIIYLQKRYFKKYQDRLNRLIGRVKIELFAEQSGYIGGEETTLLNALEGKRSEPRQKPPYPPESGFLDQPTLVNNLETFYDIALINRDEYKQKRLVCISGEVRRTGVWELLEKMTIKEILEKTSNYPNFHFFVQVGGGASGKCLNETQLNTPICALGSIVIYKLKVPERALFAHWINFFQKESCGKCVPCREGTYRLKEIIESGGDLEGDLFKDILFSLDSSSFCGLGKAVSIPIRSYWKNIKYAKVDLERSIF